ncbi:RNA methyltransferase, TrmH family [Limimonas halophila]|uniref:RNA methyltransferase, TrmH family n=1 Tax=Limimonas halophila TaxID=1082479 RepID=A0A1G7SIC4_9PROT|nr:RNA methyltransferase [Limimonas halophila]SDG22721.1 RNA methyltransferase, TrmH family [Limimonas halophila]
MARPAPVKRVTSPANTAIKAVRALAYKKQRRTTGRFMAAGERMLQEALDCGHRLETLVIHPDTRDTGPGRALETACRNAGGEVMEATEAVLAKLVGRENPPGAVGVLPQPWQQLDDLPREAARTWVVLDGLRDPGNVGGIIRSAEAAGASGVIALGETCDPFAPEAVRASTGAIFAQRLVRCRWRAFTRWRRGQGGSLVATAMHARTDYRAAAYPGPVFLLVGDEHEGIPAEHTAACDQAVRIPLHGRAESLNVGVATALLLYEVDRRRAGP